MDPIALGSFLKDAGPWGLLALSLLANKFLFDKLMETLANWRTDSQAQTAKLTAILERAAEDPTPRRSR